MLDGFYLFGTNSLKHFQEIAGAWIYLDAKSGHDRRNETYHGKHSKLEECH